MGLKPLEIYIKNSIGQKRAFCYGPEDLVDEVKKDMVAKKFVETKEIVLTSAGGELMENGQRLDKYVSTASFKPPTSLPSAPYPR